MERSRLDHSVRRTWQSRLVVCGYRRVVRQTEVRDKVEDGSQSQAQIELSDHAIVG